MSGQLMQFVSPITGPLGDLQNHFSQFASLHRDAHTRLFAQGNNLTQASGIDAFAGEGAKSFSQVIDLCIGASESCLQGLDQAVSSVGTCASGILEAVAIAAAFPLDEGMVAHVLANLTHDDVIREGGNAVSAIINDMRRMLDEMAHSGGDFFGNLIHGHFAAAAGDVAQEVAETARLVTDALLLLDELGQALAPWAQRISEGVWTCLKAIGEIAWKLVDFVLGISDIINDIKTLFNGKASLSDKLWALGDLVKNVVLDAALVIGVGEELRGTELAVEATDLLAETTLQDGVMTTVISETSLSGTMIGDTFKEVEVTSEGETIIVQVLPEAGADAGDIVHIVEETTQVTIEPIEHPIIETLENIHRVDLIIKALKDAEETLLPNNSN